MADRQDLKREFAAALGAGDLDRIEELWLTALEAPDIDIEHLLELRRALWKKGEKGLARTLLELLSDTLTERGDHAAALSALRELVRLTDKPGPELLDRLESTVRDARAGSPSLEPVLERYQLTKARRPLDQLDEVARWLDHDRGTVVEVIGQGVGRVVDANLELDTIKVDVGGRRPVSVLFAGVSRLLRRLPPGDFRRRAVEDPEGLRREVAETAGGRRRRLSEDAPSEVLPLVREVNELLDSQERALERARDPVTMTRPVELELELHRREMRERGLALGGEPTGERGIRFRGPDVVTVAEQAWRALVHVLSEESPWLK